MYEETEKKMNINWVSLVIKLLLLGLFVFILCWIFKNVGASSSSNNTVASSTYTTNLNNMKAAGFEYFTGENLPSKVGETKKLTLEEMTNQKLVVDFSNEGKTCNLQSSYIQATKTSDNNYALKVALDCDEKSDYLVTTIDNSTLAACKSAEKEGKACSAAIAELEQKIDNLSSKTGSSSSSSSSKGSSSYSSSSKSSGSYSGSYNYSGSYVPSSTTSTTSTTTTSSTSIKISSSVTCSTCIEQTKKTPIYEHVKYEWTTNPGNGNVVETENRQESTMCRMSNQYYTTSYVSATHPTKNYVLRIKNLSGKELSNYSIDNRSYFNSINDYSNYINTRDQNIEMLNANRKYNVNLNDPYVFQAYSLKSYNFNYSIGNLYKQGSEYYVNISNYMYNSNGASPVLNTVSNEYVYLTPLKFTISYDDYTSCKKNTTWYKVKTTYWSKNQYEQGYTYTGNVIYQ